MATSVAELEVTEKRLHEILEVANEWALCNGVSTKPSPKQSPHLAQPAPYALFPSVVPRRVLAIGQSTMESFSRLMHRVAMDHDFMEQSLRNVIEVDEFIRNLWNIYLKVRDSPQAQTLHLGLFRNDFMMNCQDGGVAGQGVDTSCLQLKQIEFNAIASSFGGLTQQIAHLHRLTLNLAGKKFTSDQIPDNKPATGLALGMVKAWELYASPKAVIVFIVQEQEGNVMDQRWLEFNVYQANPAIRVLRRNLLDVYNNATLDDTHRLFLDGDEVAVVYYRDGYTISNYPSQKEWDARLRLELSRAIKSPSVQHQLMGSKKIQQELARPGALERFISDPAVVSALRETFADQYSLDLGEEGDSAMRLAMASPDKFVLKPQREGGGNNLYGEEISQFFDEHKDSKERNAYILMQRIFPWAQKNYLVKSGVPFVLSNIISEIGIYGVYIGSPDKEFVNYQCGHMMRTKEEGSNEGGICVGFAVLDTPLVVE